MTDQVVLVNSADEVLGIADKLATHCRPARLHRAISVWMVNQSGELLFQRRSDQKIVGSGWWGNTVCGNVWPDESYEACALRRLQVELGITDAVVSPLLKFEYQTSANEIYNEHELDQLFISQVSKEIIVQLNLDEVSETLWIPKDEFFAEVDKSFQIYEKRFGKTYPTAAETTQYSDEKLQMCTPALEVTLRQKQVLIVPWTLIMAQFPELREAVSSAGA